MQTERKIRVGIAGFGMSGSVFHAPFIAVDGRFELKKVYERTSERSKERYPYVQVVRSFEELLGDDIDLVVITTPNAQHVPMARQALEAGKNVIVEKPIAATAAEAEELCALARRKNVLLSPYQNRRLDGDFRTVRSLIESGRLGEIVDYECHFDRFLVGPSRKRWKAEGGRGVDILYDLGVHIIDQAYVLFGMPEAVYGDLRRQREETVGIDKFEVTLFYPDKRAILSAGQLVAQPGPRYMVNGRKGTFLKYGIDVQEAALIAGAVPVGDDWGKEDAQDYGTLYTAEDGGIRSEKIATIPGSYGAYYDNIYRALTAGAELLVRPEEAADVLRIIEAAQESSESGRRVLLGSR